MFATPSQASPLSLTSVTADAASLDCSYSPRPSVASKAWDVRSLTANASTPRFYHLCPGLLRHSCDCETCALHVAHTLGLSHPAVHEPAGSWKERACARHTSARARAAGPGHRTLGCKRLPTARRRAGRGCGDDDDMRTRPWPYREGGGGDMRTRTCVPVSAGQRHRHPLLRTVQAGDEVTERCLKRRHGCMHVGAAAGAGLRPLSLSRVVASDGVLYVYGSSTP